MLWEFKNNKNATETGEKTYGLGIITDHQIRN